jgi:hypothetical protein
LETDAEFDQGLLNNNVRVRLRRNKGLVQVSQEESSKTLSPSIPRQGTSKQHIDLRRVELLRSVARDSRILGYKIKDSKLQNTEDDRGGLDV